MLLVPEALWESLIDLFQETRRRVEQVAYLDGVESTITRIVTTITIPNGALREQSYRVPPDAMSEAGKHLPQTWPGSASTGTHAPWILGGALAGR